MYTGATMRSVVLVLTLTAIALLIFKVNFMHTPQTFIPIGNSYSIGEGVSESERWPNLLANHMTQEGKATKLLANPGRTGWTTRQALENELPLVEKERPSLITILIGVNDLVQGVSVEEFERNLREILDRSEKALQKPGKIILITIPDFTLTPSGKSFGDPATIQKKLAEFNAVIKKEAADKGLPLADIYEVSVQLGSDSAYVAKDGLHPSPTAYIEWEKEIYSAIK